MLKETPFFEAPRPSGLGASEAFVFEKVKKIINCVIIKNYNITGRLLWICPTHLWK